MVRFTGILPLNHKITPIFYFLDDCHDEFQNSIWIFHDWDLLQLFIGFHHIQFKFFILILDKSELRNKGRGMSRFFKITKLS